MKALVTGFEAYGGRGINPAAEIARTLDGTDIDGLQVTGLCLPVSLPQAPQLLVERMDELAPDIILCLGLWPGEQMIRLERIALNRADFEIPDAAGLLLQDEELEPGGPDGLRATLPLQETVAALCRQGVPARLSGTAGTYLCNATFYRTLRHAQLHRPKTLVGFMHLPYLPAQVAALLEEMRAAPSLELHQRADLASMDLYTMLAAVRTTLSISAERAEP